MEERKSTKFERLSRAYLFKPIAIETSRTYTPKAAGFIDDLGHRLIAISGDTRAKLFLIQQISMAIQKGIAAAVIGAIIYIYIIIPIYTVDPRLSGP